MSLLVRDLVLSGLVYVILTYLTFRLMRRRKKPGGHDDDRGNGFDLTPPQIDLPPGIAWPVNGPVLKKDTEEEVLV